MRREKNFLRVFLFFFFTNWVYDPGRGLIEFKTHSLHMPESQQPNQPTNQPTKGKVHYRYNSFMRMRAFTS